MSTEDKSGILYVDDEKPNLQGFRYSLRNDYDIYLAESAQEAIQLLEQGTRVQIVIADHKMPRVTGTEFLEQVSEKYPDLIRILLTGYGDFDTVVQAVNKAKIYHFMSKPWKPEEMKLMLTNALEVYNLRQSNRQLIDELRQSNQELIFAKDKAEESNRLKAAFLMNLSHEIRTPMNAILGFSSLLLQPDTDPLTKIEYGAIIQQNGYELLNQIEDLLVLSNIEARTLAVHRVDIDITQLLHDVYITFQNNDFLKNKSKVSFVLKEFSGNGSRLHSDPVRIKQVLANLLDNAFKFTWEGTVELGCTLAGGETDPEAIFYVKDTGVGISTTNKEDIFERFVKLTHHDDLLYRGNGLGLSICKELAQLLGGSVSFESEKDKGSVFSLAIPFYNKNQN